MTTELLIGYAVLWVVLLKTLLMRARVIPHDCARCGLLFERQELGQAICTCDRPYTPGNTCIGRRERDSPPSDPTSHVSCM